MKVRGSPEAQARSPREAPRAAPATQPGASGWQPAPSRPSRPVTSPLPPQRPQPLTLETVRTSTTFASVSPLKQQQLTALLDGTTPISQRARAHLSRLFAQPDFQQLTPAEQGARIAQVVSSTPVTPGLVMSELAGVLGDPRPFSVHGPTEVASFDFDGTKEPALRYEIDIEGQRISVFAPRSGQFDPPNQHTLDELGRALAQMPAVSRAEVKQVHLAPRANPTDAFWAAQYGQPEFRSYMTCGADGVVRVYPQATAAPARNIATTLIHETGHTWTHRHWGADDDAARWAPWREAVRKDGLAPSRYASTNPGEDVAETTALYLATRGTPRFDEYRALYPHRFAALDAHFGAR